MIPGAGHLLRIYPALSDPAFRRIWSWMQVPVLAQQMQTLVTGYVAFLLSGSATAIGLVTFTATLPAFTLSLAGGVIADRFPRRRVVLATYVIHAIAQGAQAWLAWNGTLAVWHLALAAFVQGCAYAFGNPARYSYVVALAGESRARSAMALNSAAFNFSRVAGPALAGSLMSVDAVGIPGVFALMALAQAAALVTLVRTFDPPVVRRVTQNSAVADLVEGLRYVKASPSLFALLVIGLVALLFGIRYQALLPLFAERVFAVGPAGLGALGTAIGLGAFTGSLGIGAFSSRARPIVLKLILTAVWGTGLVVFALTPVFLVALPVVFVCGLASASFGTLNNSLLIGYAEPPFYGRVTSIWILSQSMIPLGTLPAAWAAEHFGAAPTVAATGVLVVAVVVIATLVSPAFRNVAWVSRSAEPVSEKTPRPAT